MKAIIVYFSVYFRNLASKTQDEGVEVPNKRHSNDHPASIHATHENLMSPKISPKISSSRQFGKTDTSDEDQSWFGVLAINNHVCIDTIN